MRIIQLSTGHLGGAGLAARRLNHQLNLHGVNSTFIALAQKTFVPGGNEVQVDRDFFVKTIGASLAAMQRSFSEETLMSSISMSSNVVSRILQLSKPQETIIQIHNWQNIINFKTIDELQKLGFKIVLTLHDQRFFTGGCHYSYSCMRFQGNCSGCPQTPRGLKLIPKLSLQHSMKVSFNQDSIVVVGPSKWIVDLAQKSSVLKNVESQVVPNVLGGSWLNIVRGISFRKNLKFTVGVASLDPFSFIKGGDIIQRLQSYLPSAEFSIIYLSEFPNTRQVHFWEQIDCLFVPSREDNSPNVILEAKSLGIPVVASNAGGIPEILDRVDFCLDMPDVMDINFLISIFERLRISNRVHDSIENLAERVIKRDSAIIGTYKTIYSKLLS